MAEVIDTTQTSHCLQHAEIDLLARVKAGDQVACAELIALFGPKMMAVTRSFMRCEDDRDEVLQDAFISAFKAFDRFAGNSRLSTWLHRITVNSCLLKLRKGSARRETSIDEMLSSMDQRSHSNGRIPAIEDPAAEAETEDTCAVVRRSIDRLPDGDRRVLLLRDIEEMNTADTASSLGMTVHNVKRRLYRARRTLRALLVPMMEEQIG